MPRPIRPSCAPVVRWNGVGDYATARLGRRSTPEIDASTTPGLGHLDRFDTTDTSILTDASRVRVSDRVRAAVQRHAASAASPPVRFRMVLPRGASTCHARGPVRADRAVGRWLRCHRHHWTGSEPLTFSATDRGGGLFRVIVEADGVPVKALPAVADDRCVDRTGGRDFGYPVPCPTQGAGSVSIAAADLPGGLAHRRRLPRGRGGQSDGARSAYGRADRQRLPRGRLLRERDVLQPSVRDAAGGQRRRGHQWGAADGLLRAPGRQAARVTRCAVRSARCASRRARRSRARSPLLSGEPIADATVFIGQQPEGSRGASTARSARTPRGTSSIGRRRGPQSPAARGVLPVFLQS